MWIDLKDYPSSYDIEQRNPDPNKHAVQKLFAERCEGKYSILFAAPTSNGRWGIFRGENNAFATGDTPHDAWLAALRKLREIPAPPAFADAKKIKAPVAPLAASTIRSRGRRKAGLPPMQWPSQFAPEDDGDNAWFHDPDMGARS